MRLTKLRISSVALSTRSVAIFEMLANNGELALTSLTDDLRVDLSRAARQALHLNRTMIESAKIGKAHLQKYPRTYERWAPNEDDQLRCLYLAGKTLREMATSLQRPPKSIRARLSKVIKT